MIWPGRLKITFKTISVVVAGIFLWNQIAWAADLYTPVDKFNDQQSQQFAPAYLQNQEAIHQNLIDQKNTVENDTNLLNQTSTQNTKTTSTDETTLPLQGPQGGGVEVVSSESPQPSGQSDGTIPDTNSIYSITTETGDIIYYENGEIYRIELHGTSEREGIVIHRVEGLSLRDDAGNLLNGDIDYPDGIKQEVRNGKVIKITKADGTIFTYNTEGPDEGRIRSIIYPDGTEVFYTYNYDTEGSVSETILTAPEKISYYDSNNKLKKIVFNSGKQMEYENGIITSITNDPQGQYFLKRITTAANDIEVIVYRFIDNNGYIIDLNDDGTITSIISPQNVKITYSMERKAVSLEKEGLFIFFDSNERIHEAVTSSADYIYEYEEDINRNIIKTTIKELITGYEAVYGQDGRLVSVTGQGVTVTREIVEALEAELAVLNNQLEEAAQTRRLAEETLILRQVELQNATLERLAAETALNEANSRLERALAARQAVEAKLPGETQGYVTRYQYDADGKITLNQDRIVLNEKFDSYNSALWQKPADSLVQITQGEALLTGTGIDYSATFYSKNLYSRQELPVFSFDFKVSSAYGYFAGGLENNLTGRSYRRVALLVKSGAILVTIYDGVSYKNITVAIPQVKVNKYYTCQLEADGSSTKIYVWEKGTAKPSQPAYIFTKADWDVRPFFLLKSGKAWVDNARVDYTLPVTKVYDSQGSILEQNLQDGIVTTYEYVETTKAIKRDTDAFEKSKASPLWALPSTRYYSLSQGAFILKGNNVNTAASFYHKLYPTRSSNPAYSIDFTIDNTNPYLYIGLDGKLSGSYRRLALVAFSGNIYVQTSIGSVTSTVATAVSGFKLNTPYTVAFEVTASDIKVYIWEKGGAKPANPAYTWATTGWNARFRSWLKTGTARFDNFSISQKVIAPTPTTLILDLKRALDEEKAAYNAIPAAEQAYNEKVASENLARSAVSQAESSLASARAEEEVAAGRKNAKENELAPLKAQFSRFNGTVANYDFAQGLLLNFGDFIDKVPFSKIVYSETGEIKDILKPTGDKVYYYDGLTERAFVDGKWIYYDWTTLMAAYTYYSDIDNRIASKTLVAPDAQGNIYYHYIDENWNMQGYGRVDIAKRLTPDTDNTMAYKFTYSTVAPERVITKEHYSDTDLSVLISQDSYYDDADNRLESVRLASPDSQGFVYYHYTNTNWNNQGHGWLNEAIRKEDSGGNASGEQTTMTAASYFGIFQFVFEIIWRAIIQYLFKYEYDEQGRVTKRTWLYTGEFTTISYYSDTSTKYREASFKADWTWKYTIEYWTDGVTKHYEWFNDPNPTTKGDVTFREYYSNGKLHREEQDNYDIHTIEYYANGNKKSDAYFYKAADQSWVWIKTIQYFENDPTKIQYEWIADPNPNTAGDVISWIYDLNGRVSNLSRDNGYTEAFIYYGSTSNIYKHSYNDPNGTWQKTIEYYQDGTTMHYQWIVDSNPAQTGDVVAFAYDAEGMQYLKRFDSGEQVDYTTVSYYTNWQYPSSSLRVATDPYGEIATFKYINSKWVINSVVYDESLVSWSYDASGNVTGHTKILSDGTVKVYDQNNKLIEKRVPDSDFIQGVNLPWINYGYDMGGGITNNLAALYTQLEKWKGSVVRVFLFSDLRSGINFDLSGNPISFKTGVSDDMNALISAAKAFNIKLIPVLFDYMLADGKSGTYLGEHADLISDTSKKQALLNLFGAFFDTFAGNSSIYAWDVMNEPEFAGAVAISDTQNFISDFTKLIHSKSREAKVTVGSARRDWLLQYWTDIGLDIYQYHYYDKYESTTPINSPLSDLNLDKPVIAGELEPTQVGSKLSTLKMDGYSAGLFWQDSTYIINSADYAAIRSYFSGDKATYAYYPSGRIESETWTNGMIRDFEDSDFYADATGRVTKETFPDNSYITYEYYGNESVLKTVTSFLSSGSKVIKKDYDLLGALITVTTYYDNGSIREVSNSDGTYVIWGQTGNILEEAVKIGDTVSVRDSQGTLLREILTDGTINEYSSYPNVLRILEPDGSASEYYHDGNGSVLARYEYSADGSFTIFDGQGKTVFTYIYNASDMQILQDDPSTLSLTTALGDVITYKDDKILSIKRKADNSLITAVELDENGDLKNAHVLNTNGSLDIVVNNYVVESISSDGVISRYRDNRKAFDYSKQVGYTRYYYTEDANHSVTSVTAINKNATCVYDATGLPVRFKKSDGSITEYDRGYLKRIIDSTGRQYIYTIATGTSPSSTLTTTATGNSIPSEVLYDTSSNITSVILPDGTTVSSANGILQGITGLDSKINIEISGTFSFDDGSYKAYYDKKGNLEKIKTSDNTDVYFDNGEVSNIQAEDGTSVLYTGGRISELYDRKEGATYESDSQGRVTMVKYDGGATFTYHYDPQLADGSVKVTIIKEGDAANVTVRIYDKDGLLIEQYPPSGVISKYTYETSGDKRILNVTQTKNGVTIGSYTYQYLAEKTLVTDINQNEKEYDLSGNIKFMYTPEGYVYEYHMTENGTLVRELGKWNKGDGITIYYKNGDVDRVETIVNGKKTTLKEAVFDPDGKLKSFTVILPTGESRRITVYDKGWSEVKTSDAKLIYRDDPDTGNGHLVAVNSNHRLFMFDNTMKIPSYISVDITDDPAALDHIALVDGEITEYMRQKLLKDYGVIKENPVPNTLVPGNRTWLAQTYPDTLGISSVSTTSDMIVMQAAINNTYGHSQGEAFLDLTIDNIGHTIASPYDFNNKTMSFYVKLQDGTLPAGKSLVVQAFAKDSYWRSEYSMQVTITEAGTWFKVDLDISAMTPIFGLKDFSFDPSRIRLVGIRIMSTAANFTYNGQIYLKDANHQSPPAGEKVIDFPFLVNKNSIKPYVGTIPADQVVGNPNYISWADIPTLFLANNNTGNNGQINLDQGTWRAQAYAYSLGVEKLTRDNANDQWVLSLNLAAGDQTRNDGEMYVDLRYDIPDYTWSGPLDLTGKTLTFKVKAPLGFLEASNSVNSPMWAQVFVKDENYNYQYGKHVQITKEGEWLTVTLIPQVGEIEEGNSKTSPDFDPTKIVNIGVKISCNKGSVSAYQGNFYVQNATPVDVLNQATGVYLLDINALKNYAQAKNLNLTYEDNLGPQIRLAKQSLPTYFKDASFNMGTEYYPDGSVKRVLKGNARIESYNTYGKLIRITDTSSKTLVEYKYDSNGDLTEVDYSGTRDNIRNAMNEARMVSQQAADNTIKQIYEAKFQADQYVHDTIQPSLNEAYAVKANLESLKREWENKDTGWFGKGWFGDCSQDEKNATLDSINGAIYDINQVISNLLAKASDWYAGINESVGKAKYGDGDKPGIDQELAETFAAIDDKETRAIEESLKEEVREVVSVYYKKTLGRNASTEEMNNWLAKAKIEGSLDPLNRKAFDVSLVKTELAINQAYIDEALLNNTFINNVNTKVAAYLRNFAEVADKNAELSAYLGLSPSDINYNPSDFEAIIKWLSSNNKHFGKSSFAALAEILKNNGKAVDQAYLEDLAIKTILIDIFTNSITSITTSELEISIFALSKYAYIKEGLNLYNVKLDNTSLDGLQDAIENGKKAIVRVEGNHFIVIESIAADGTVSYKEPSNGSQGEVMTMAKEDFLASWDGYAITEKALRTEDTVSRVLSDSEAMRIRGSEPTVIAIFAILSVIFAIASTVLSFIDNEIAQLLSKVFAILSLVTGILNIVVNFGYIINSFVTGLQNIGNILETSVTFFTSLFTNGLEGFVTGVATILSRTVIGISLNMSYNKALTTFGLNSDLAGITSAFLSGGFTGVDQAFSLTGAFSNLTIEGVRYAGRELDLDPAITSIIGTSAATIVSAGLGGVAAPVYNKDGVQIATALLKGFDAISYVIGTTLLPNVASELAYYGITKLGDMLGISEISYIAGMGIRSTISAGLRGYNANDIFKEAVGGMFQGITSIGINYATQELGLNPILANIGFSAIASAINAGIQSTIGPIDPVTGKRIDVFESFFKTYMDNALTFLGYGNPNDPNYTWLQASYKQSILDFTDIIRKDGLVVALNTYGVSFFNSTTIGAIVQSGMTIGRYFDDKLKSNQFRIDTTPSGRQYADVAITNGSNQQVGSAFFDWTVNPDGSIDYYLIGKQELYSDHTFFGIGDLGKDSYGNLGFWNDATLMDTYSTFTNMQRIDDGYQIHVETTDLQGNIFVEGDPLGINPYLTYDAYGKYISADISYLDILSVSFNNGETTNYSYLFNSDFTPEMLDLGEEVGWIMKDQFSKYRVSFQMNNRGKPELYITLPTFDPNTISLDNIPINNDPLDNGMVWHSLYSPFEDITADSIATNLNDMFSIYGNFDPYQFVNDNMPTGAEKMFSIIGDALGSYFNANIADAEDLPPWAKDVARQVSNELSIIGDGPADVRMYTKDLLGLKGIYETISSQLSPGTFMLIDVDRPTFAYDNITTVDAQQNNFTFIDVVSKIVNKIPVLEKYVPYMPLVENLVDNLSFHRTQPYDATQKVYNVEFIYRPSNQGTQYPIRRFELETRIGQYTTPTGGTSYGIVATDLKIYETLPGQPFNFEEKEHKRVP